MPPRLAFVLFCFGTRRIERRRSREFARPMGRYY
jgi:hypothetical protein